MRHRHWLLLIVALLGLTSCVYKSAPFPFMTKVDSLLEVKPDSALSLLESLTDVESMSSSQQAEYALLLTKAMDKNMLPFVNDSLIKTAVDYYQKSSDEYIKADAYYYQGRVYRQLGDDKFAVESFLAALDALGENTETKLNVIINANLASCYTNQGLYARAMERYRKAYSIGLKIADKENYAFLLRDIGNTFLFLEEPDSALNYYQQGLAVAYSANDSLWTSTILFDIAHFYNERAIFDKANEYVSQAIYFNPESEDLSSYYFLKGSVFLSLERNDSADYYIKKSLENANMYIKAASNLTLYNLSKTSGRYGDAVNHIDEYILYIDSIQYFNQREEIAKLMNDYALESHKKEVTVKQQRFMLYLVIAFLMLITLAVYIFFYLDRRKKKELIGLQEELMQNRSKLMQYQNVLANSKSEFEKERQENESAQRLLEARQKELCMRLFQTKAVYRIIQDFEASRKQKKVPKELTEQDAAKIQQAIEEIYIDFIQQYQYNFPQLSEGDVYCCALAYMEFSNPLIAYLMRVDPNVVTQRRYRIKGKLDEQSFNSIFGASSGGK
ncbi:tetratricopeptide repeat protein [Bacteroides sp. 224]|uniref:tetratricopeptide repeat protein n=1 Tax=Bacteroides sp. 224 TaxID=2302936 RepID=UPI0013D53574|nr:tetratricopeptide repeat protein [Bacteroides sp. 224]NDV65477.1 hypothetical protein [Bacteroides sp. 224]